MTIQGLAWRSCREFGHPVSRPEFFLLFGTFELDVVKSRSVSFTGLCARGSIAIWEKGRPYLEIDHVDVCKPFSECRLLESLKEGSKRDARKLGSVLGIHLCNEALASLSRHGRSTQGSYRRFKPRYAGRPHHMVGCREVSEM